MCCSNLVAMRALMMRILLRFRFSPNNYDQARSDGSDRDESLLDFRMFRIENLKVIAEPERFTGLFDSNVVLSLV